MTTEVSELITRLRLMDETKAGLEAANQNLRKVAEGAEKAEKGVESLGQGVQATDRQFTAAGRSIGTVVRSIDGTATAAAAANRVLRQHADAVEKLRLQHEREGRSAAETAEALRRLDVVRDNGLARARAAGARVEAQFVAQAQAVAPASEQLSRFGTVADQVQRAAEGMSGRLGAAGVALSAIGVGGAVAAAALAGIGAGLAAIARAGDQATATLGRLQAATGSATAARDVYEQLYQASQRTGIAVVEAAGTFQRFQIAAGEIGATRDQVLRLVDGLQKVAIVSGASGQEGAAAMQQLGQALASGKLNGDELRSVMENMPSLAQQLARELGTNIGQLRKMGEEGQLTADKVFPALLRATEKMAGDFDKLPVTMSRSFDILGAAMLDFTAKLDEALGLSSAIARAAKAAADAVNGARRSLLPTEREQLTDAAAASRNRIAALQGQLATDEQINTGYRFEADRVRMRGRNDDIRRQLAAEESQLRTHNDRLAEIEKEGQADRFGQFVTAREKAAVAARTTAEAEFKAAESNTQKLIKLDQDYLKQVQIVDAAERTGAVSADRIAAQRLALADDYYKDRQKLLKEMEADDDKATRRAESAAAKEVKARDAVLAKLRTELDGRQRLADAQGQGAEAVAALAVETEIENRLREAGIPIAGRRTEEEQRYAERIAGTVRAIDKLKVAEKAGADARAEAAKESERVSREVESTSRRIADDVATSVYEGLVEKRRGQTVIDWFGNLFKRIAIQAAATQIFLPITTGIVGAIPQLFGIAAAGSGASGSASLIGQLGQLTGLSNLLPSGGLGGMFSGLSSSIFGTAGTVGGSFADLGGITIAGTAGSPGLFGLGGTSLMGGSSLTLGGAFGSIGGGMAISSLLNSALGRSSAQSTNGMIGSGLGGLAGFLIGGPLGGLIGGTLGGLGGGLIGPGESVRGYGLRLQSNAYNEAIGGTNDYGTSLLPISYQFYNEEGRAVFQQAEQQVAATNAYLGARNLRVAGASVIGGNRFGPDLAWADAGSVGEGFSRLRFQAVDNAELDDNIRKRFYNSIEELQTWVEGFLGVQQAVKNLSAEPVPAFTQQMDALKAQFDTLSKQAKDYGVAETGLAEARAKAIAALEAQRTETLRQADVSLAIRRLAAGDQTQEAELARQAEAARQELRTFGDSLDALALTAADKAARLVELEEVQAAERAAIIRRYGEEAAAALRTAGGTIRQYLDRLAAGTEGGQTSAGRLAAAQGAFERDRMLAMGGDRDALGRITGSADTLLGVGRDLYASSGGYQQILQQVTAGLSGLPVVQSYDAMQAASLAAIEQAITAGTLNTATTILPAGNVVQLAGGTFPAASAADLAATAANTANTVGTLVNGIASLILATANSAAAIAQSLAVVNASIAEANAGQFAIAAASTASLGAIDAGTRVTAEAIAAANDNILATGNALHAGQAVANALLAGVQAQVLASGAAQLAGLADLNTSLATIHRSAVDINASLATLHATTLMGAALLANGLAVVAQAASATNASVLATGAALQAGQVVLAQGQAVLAQGVAISNGGLAVLNGSVLAGNAAAATGNGHLAAIRSYASFIDNTLKAANNYAIDGNGRISALNATMTGVRNGVANVNAALAVLDRTARDINASLAVVDRSITDAKAALGVVDASVRDVNASLAVVHGAIANGLAVVASGQDITAGAVVAAGAGLQQGQAIANSFLASIATSTAAMAAANSNTPGGSGLIYGTTPRNPPDGTLGLSTPALPAYGTTPRTPPIATLSSPAPALALAATAASAPASDLAALLERLEAVLRELALLQASVTRDGLEEVAEEVRGLRRPLERVASR